MADDKKDPITQRAPDPKSPTRPSPAVLRDSRAEPDEPLELEGIESEPTSGAKILVIDNDTDIIEALRSALGEEGYRVWTATDGLEGLERLFEMPSCDVILLDLLMPRVDGLSFLRVFDRYIAKLDDLGVGGSPPSVVIISGQRPPPGDLDDRFVFMGKPLDLDTLVRTIRKHAGAPRKRGRKT